jgi:hypothetical protein
MLQLREIAVDSLPPPAYIPPARRGNGSFTGSATGAFLRSEARIRSLTLLFSGREAWAAVLALRGFWRPGDRLAGVLDSGAGA